MQVSDCCNSAKNVNLLNGCFSGYVGTNEVCRQLLQVGGVCSMSSHGGQRSGYLLM